jgi:hypothetical protein
MKLQQLSLFMENKPGALRAPCETLAAAGIDLMTMSLADTTSFGILRFIVADPEAAKKVLEKAGMVVRTTEVVPVEVANKPGGLAQALGAIEDAGLAVEYMYDFGAACQGDHAAIVFRFEDPDRAIEALQKAGVRILSREELMK